MTDLKVTKGRANVFADLGFGLQESQNLLLRSQTMIALVHWFNASGLTQAAASKALGVTQPRLNQLLKGKIEIFSLDATATPPVILSTQDHGHETRGGQAGELVRRREGLIRDIQEGIKEADAGEFASEEQVQAVFKKYGA